MFATLRQDARRLSELKARKYPWCIFEAVLLDNGFQAVVLHRLAHWFRSRGVPVLGPLVARLNLFLTAVDISPAAEIGPGLAIGHGVGLVVGGGAKIGAGAMLLHQVTIGAPSLRRLEQMPVLGDRVFVGAGARIIGGVTIGDDVFIGTNAIVTESVPAGCKVVATAAVAILGPATI